MPSLEFEEPVGGPLAEKRARDGLEQRPERARNTVKIGALAVLAAVVLGVVLLVTTGGGDDTPDSASPAVPTIDSPHSDDSAPTTTSRRAPAAMGGAATTKLVVTTTAPPPPPPQQPTTEPSDPGFEYAVLNAPCPREGDFSITEQGEFVQCQPDDGRLIWQRP
jgi:type IV secretory pathway VirB10-like protein